MIPEVHELPAVNALLNATASVWLALGWWFIRRRRVAAHRACMIAAVATSVLFLACYLAYHLKTGSTPFQSRGWVRGLYFSVLISHSVLAAIVFPLVLVTLFRALKNDFHRHRRVARWTWPIWMYVSVTGVVIYLMLYHLDPALLGSDGGTTGDAGNAGPRGETEFTPEPLETAGLDVPPGIG